MEFVGKAGESGGGMYVVSIFLKKFKQIFFKNQYTGLYHLSHETQCMDAFLDSRLRSAQSAGKSSTGHA